MAKTDHPIQNVSDDGVSYELVRKRGHARRTYAVHFPFCLAAQFVFRLRTESGARTFPAESVRQSVNGLSDPRQPATGLRPVDGVRALAGSASGLQRPAYWSAAPCPVGLVMASIIRTVEGDSAGRFIVEQWRALAALGCPKRPTDRFRP